MSSDCVTSLKRVKSKTTVLYMELLSCVHASPTDAVEMSCHHAAAFPTTLLPSCWQTMCKHKCQKSERCEESGGRAHGLQTLTICAVNISTTTVAWQVCDDIRATRPTFVLSIPVYIPMAPTAATIAPAIIVSSSPASTIIILWGLAVHISLISTSFNVALPRVI